MIENLAPITEADMFEQWGRAELPESHRRGDEQVPQELVAKLAACEVLTPAEHAKTVELMRSLRVQIVKPPLDDGMTRWFTGEIPLPEIGDVLLDGYWTSHLLLQEWAPPTPFDVRTWVEHPRFDAQSLTMAGPFRFACMRGRPILLGPTRFGPWGIVEGSNRLRAMWTARNAADAPASIKVVVGVHPMASRWKNSDVYQALARLHWRRGASVSLERRGSVAWLVCRENGRDVEITEQCFDALVAGGLSFDALAWLSAPIP
jgi:hypothetical protein